MANPFQSFWSLDSEGRLSGRKSIALPGIGIYIYISGQIIATSHDLTPNGGLVREIPLFQGNLGW